MKKRKLRILIKEEFNRLVEDKFGQPKKRGENVFLGSTKLDHLATINGLDAYSSKYNIIYIFDGNNYLGFTNNGPDHAAKLMNMGARI